MTDRKEYMRELMRKKRAANKPANKSTKSVSKKAVSNPDSVSSANIDWQDQVDKRIFDKVGRGIPVNGFVLISRGLHIADDIERDRVVTEEAWRTRLGQTCEHGSAGWTCKRCL